MKNFHFNADGNSKARSRNFFTLLVLLLTVPFLAFADNFSVNKSSSTVKWEASKVTGKHDGTIAFDNGSFVVKGQQIEGGKFVIDMNSIVCTDITDAGTNKKFVGHLRSDDFFSVEKHSTATLDVKKAEKMAGSTYKFIGDLTIKGITKPIEFTADVKMEGNKLSASGVMTINRTHYDIKYGSGSFFSDLGDRMIYDDFKLDFVIVADKK